MSCRYTYKGKTYEVSEFDDLLRAMTPAEAAAFMPSVEAVPSAPFVQKTDAWVALALKRIIKMAVDEGYDRVAFINGEQSAERYDLSKQVDALRLDGDWDQSIEVSAAKSGQGFEHITSTTKDKLADVIGKELASKALETGQREFKGLDLKVGGEGMRAFYDQIVPSVLKDVLRKVGGGSIGESQINTTGSGVFQVWLPDINDFHNRSFSDGMDAAEFADQVGGKVREVQQSTPQMSFDITPAMRERAAGGLPMFDRQGDLLRTLQAAVGRQSVQDVQAIVDEVASKWAAPVKVVATPDDLPIPAPSDARGLHYKGTIYVVASTNRTRASVLKTLGHEAVAHYGLRGMLGREEWRKLMGRINTLAKMGNGPLREIQAYVRRTYVDDDGAFNLSETQEADEIAARAVEQGIDPQTGEFRPGFGWLKAVFAKIAEFLRGLGITVPFTNLELQGALVNAQAFLSREGQLAGSLAPAMSRAPGFFFNAEQSPLYQRRTAQSVGVISKEQADQALATDAVARRIMAKGIEVNEGDRVGARLNINVLKNTGVAVNTIHRGKAGDGYTKNRGWWGGEVIAYAPVVTLRDAYFNVDQKAREGIAAGAQAKSPMASIDGAFHKAHSFDGVEFRFNPKREHLFRDALGRVLKRAEEVTITGNSAFVRGEIEYYGAEDVPARAGDAPSQGRLLEPGNDAGDQAFARGDAAKQVVTDVLRQAGNKAVDYRSIALGALGRRQIVDLYGREIPQLRAYNQLMQAMDADKNEAGAEADGIADRWGKLKDQQKLAELMHDATLAQIDAAQPFVPGDDFEVYSALSQAFRALSPEAQALYREARDAYAQHHENVRRAIRDRIMRSAMSSQRKAELMMQMDAEFFRNVKGVYFPLARFGSYVVVVRDATTGRALSVNRAETMNEAETLQAELRKAFPDAVVGKVLKDREFNAGRDMVGRGFMENLYEALGRKDMDDVQRAELEDMLGQLYLSALPDLSWAKHGIHRKGTPGFSQDARRAFAQNMFHGARYLAKVRYSDLLENQLSDAQKQITAMADVPESETVFDSVRAQQVLDEMVKRHDAAMNPTGNALSSALTSLGFVFHLGLSPASALVNLTQTALVAYPVMGAKWGFDRSAAALLVASKQAATNRNDISKVLEGDERRAYDEAVRSGVIDVTMAHDLAGIAQGEDAKVTWKLRPIMRWASFLFHHAERFNRQVTFVASYRLAKEAGAKHAQAYAQAVQATYDGHFDYSATNRPRFMQGNAAKVILLFKQYAQNMVYTLGRQAYLAATAAAPAQRAQARKALGGILAMHAMAAGVLGLPLVGTLLTVASWLGSDDDEPWDAEVALRNMLADTFGSGPADVLARGLSRMTPFDISGRVGLDKLILPDIQEGLEGQRLGESAMAAALGPVAGIGITLLKGLQEVAEGDWARGLEAMTPSFARGPLKALRYAQEGAIDRTGKPIVEDVNDFGILGQALGLSPSDVRLATEAKSAVHQADMRLNRRRAQLLRQFALAAIAGDLDGVRDGREAIERFNSINSARRITAMNMAQSIRRRRLEIEQAQGGVYLPRNRRDAYEAGEFGLSQ